MTITVDDIKRIELETRGQQSTDMWWHYRKEKLTASNFYNAAVTQVEPSNKIKSLFYSSVHTAGMSHGVENERSALLCYT